MENELLETWFIISTVLTSMLCGASLDQSLKQLPSRHHIGIKAFSAYAKAADLKNGVIWYTILGAGAASASIVTAIIHWRNHADPDIAIPIYLSAFFAVCHSICTARAAPTYHMQKNITNEKDLKKLFDRFEVIQTIRSLFIVTNVASFVWAMAIEL
jgi:hypothetical protein